MVSAIDQDMTVEEVARPEPHAGEVLLRVAACGVCHSDLHVLRGEVAFPLPCVLGHEVSGVVEEVGAGVVRVQPGDRVVCSFIMPCGRCDPCRRGEEDLCEEFFAQNRLRGTLYDGTSRLAREDGSALAMYSMAGFAQFCVVPETGVFVLPDGVDLADAAVLGCAVFTAFGLLRNVAALRAGESVVVVGTGGVGSAVVQLARLFGAAQVVAVDVRRAALDAALGVGATHAVDSRDGDLAEQVRAAVGPRGADLVVEAFGSPGTFADALGCVRDGGRVGMAGIAPAGVTASFEIARVVRRKIRILGTFGARPSTDMPALLDLVAAGSLVPGRSITRRYRLSEVNEAFRALRVGETVGRSTVVLDG